MPQIRSQSHRFFLSFLPFAACQTPFTAKFFHSVSTRQFTRNSIAFGGVSLVPFRDEIKPTKSQPRFGLSQTWSRALDSGNPSLNG